MSGTKARLATRVADALRTEITEGRIRPGDRLLSETRLAELHGVSRTVVREAIATLSFEGLVQARKGAGLFALQAQPGPFLNLDMGRVSSVIELLELRRAVEVESAGLAALRRSPQQDERILAAHQTVLDCLSAGTPTRDADFAFHLAIADATNNPRFPEFLTLVRVGIIPRGELQTGQDNIRPQDYNRHLDREHAAICRAILDGDEAAARVAMQEHLKGSLARYRALLRGNQHTAS
ncbi:FadR/GntR family transcriptional regulator [Falsirhodobacter sp. 20TX0035]|uniref:FadR/GntR family transcriptional regulator n=1 Tax=Falsirhodobacter sp. 20TX0035 TaxID=3022019 RepID=UPI00232E3859|nr:FadR/GntR family transcriptional regulator [Falsirhodobacter sp. 20TX0035]MDB6452846.1 FadR/GntR family transcriptional regulator [Falsirhodobacter sp. 20TX0035]